jgi:hypothetical protein
MLRKLCAAVVLVAVVLVGFPLRADNHDDLNPGVWHPDTVPYGKTYGEWAGAWWNWGLHIPSTTITDPDGSLGHLGQEGNVWFLAGNFGGVSHRALTVPPEKALFFSLINTVRATPEAIIRGGGDPTTMTHEEQEAFLRNLNHATIESTDSLVAHVDGVALQDLFAYRAESPPGGFVLHIPEGSIVSGSYAPGDHDPAVADGYWLMLEPLSPGEHQIHFSSGRPGFSLDLTYDLTIIPEPSSIALLGLGAVGLIGYGWRRRRRRML